jgi:hypothetical protein
VDRVGNARQVFDGEFIERNGALGHVDEFHTAAEAVQPGGDLGGVAHAAAEEEKLSGRRREGERHLIIEPAHGVGEHLVFVEDEESRGVAREDALALGLEGGDQDGGVKIFRQISGGDADIHAEGLPLAPFVVGEGAGGDRVDGLAEAGGFGGCEKEFEDAGLPGSGGGVDDDVGSGFEMANGLLLPEVGEVERDEEPGGRGGLRCVGAWRLHD